MDNVVRLDDHRPHLTGEATCLSCDFKWVSAAPLGTSELKCPSCKTYKGVFIGTARPEVVWRCAPCGNEHWYITMEGFCCSRCGNHNDFSELFIND